MAKVLFIDDDFFTLETYSKMVSLYDHNALMADKGQQALIMAREESPDLIILDLSMPDMDGFAILKHLRADELTAEIPVVVVTASRDEFAKRVKQEGAQGFAAKPLRANELSALIDQYALSS